MLSISSFDCLSSDDVRRSHQSKESINRRTATPPIAAPAIAPVETLAELDRTPLCACVVVLVAEPVEDGTELPGDDVGLVTVADNIVVQERVIKEPL